MLTININDAHERFLELMKQAQSGESFIIADADNPLVTVMPYTKLNESKRLGFMRGQCVVPDDVKAVGREEIIAMFEERE